MSHKVVTTDGILLSATSPGDGGKPLTEAQANARCEQANSDAVALGIQARYVVQPA